jgi:hypothetical protein
MWTRKMLFKLLLSFLITITSLFAGPSSKDYSVFKEIDFKKIGPHQGRALHIKMVRTIIYFENRQKFDDFHESFYSFNKVWKELTGLAINECHAADGDLCLFGGWPSVEKNSKCRAPWSGEAQVAQEANGLTKYLDNGKCGDGNLFRCNPAIFGPGRETGVNFSETAPLPSSASVDSINGMGSNSNPAHGICVKLDGSYNELSKKCGDVSSALDKARQENGKPDWRNDEFFQSRAADYKKLLELVGEKCARAAADSRPTDGMCESLQTAAANVFNAGMANQINDEILSTMGLSCVQEQRVTAPTCNPENRGPILDLMWQGLAEAIGTEDDCRAKFAITKDGNVADNFGDSCNISITAGALAYSQEIPHGPGDVRSQTYKIVYMDGSEKKVLELESSNNTTAEAIKDKFLADYSTDLKNACEQAYHDKCIPEDQPGLTNLQAALDDLKQRDNCRFAKVQAFDDGSMTTDTTALRRDSIWRCNVGIGGNLQNTGIASEQDIHIGMSPGIDSLPQFIKIRLDDDTSKEDILAQLTSGDNQERFEEICSSSQNGMCGAVADSALGTNVQRQLRELADLEVDGKKCDFSYLQLHPGDYMDGATADLEDDGPSDSAIPGTCRALLSEGAARELETNTYPKRFKLQVRRGGKVELADISIGTTSAISLHALKAGTNPFLHDLCKEELVETPTDATERERRELAGLVREFFGEGADIENIMANAGPKLREQLKALQEGGIRPPEFQVSLNGGKLQVVQEFESEPGTDNKTAIDAILERLNQGDNNAFVASYDPRTQKVTYRERGIADNVVLTDYESSRGIVLSTGDDARQIISLIEAGDGEQSVRNVRYEDGNLVFETGNVNDSLVARAAGSKEFSLENVRGNISRVTISMAGGRLPAVEARNTLVSSIGPTMASHFEAITGAMDGDTMYPGTSNRMLVWNTTLPKDVYYMSEIANLGDDAVTFSVMVNPRKWDGIRNDAVNNRAFQNYLFQQVEERYKAPEGYSCEHHRAENPDRVAYTCRRAE